MNGSKAFLQLAARMLKSCRLPEHPGTLRVGHRKSGEPTNVRVLVPGSAFRRNSRRGACLY